MKYNKLNITLNITDNCNLNCDYCYQKFRIKSNKTMDYNFAKNAIKRLNEKYDKLHVDFLGGEPLIEFNFIKKIITEFEHNNDISFSLTSNGTLLDNEKISFFKNKKIYLVISIDGNKKAQDSHRKFKNNKGSYDTLMNNLSLVQKNNIRFGFNLTYTPNTISYLYDSLCILKDFNAVRINISPSLNSDFHEEDFFILNKEVHKIASLYMKLVKNKFQFNISPISHGIFYLFNNIKKPDICRIGENNVTINYDEDIYPCQLFKELKNKDKYVSGTYNDYDFSFIREQMKSYKENIFGCEKACENCDIRNYCSRGCPGANLIQRENIFNIDKNTYFHLKPWYLASINILNNFSNDFSSIYHIIKMYKNWLAN